MDSSNASKSLGVNVLNMKGAIMPTHIDGKRPDAREFWPLYEKLTAFNVPLFIHPTMPLGFDSLNEPTLSSVVAFPFETTITVTRMLLGGIFDKFPRLKVVAAHLGGAIPYLAGRISKGVAMHAGMSSRTAFAHLQRIFLDTRAFHVPSIMCTYEFHGAERLLLGSDYPYGWCNRTEAREIIQNLNIPQSAKNRILAENTRTILKLDVD